MLRRIGGRADMSATLAMLGPIELAQFRDLLDPSHLLHGMPKGLGGSPVNLLSRELLRRGRHLLVVSLDPAVADEVILEGPNLKICLGPFRPKRARDFFAAERAYLVKVLRRERPDAVHAQWTYEFALAAQASGLPHVITAHDAPMKVLRMGFRPYRIARTMMAYRVLSRAKRVVSVSPYVARHLSQYMLYRGAAEVIANGMPESLFARRPAARSMPKPLTFVTILPGWAGLKNGQVAVAAFARMHANYPDSRLIMFGAGHGPGEAGERWARSQGLADGIEFAGHTPYETVINRLTNEADVLVHPSLEESFGMVLIEAMALGLPVIGGKNSGGVPWTLDHGKAGILVDVTDPAAVATAMEKLANSVERQAWGQRGYEHTRSRFHIGVVADAYEKIYSELLSQSETGDLVRAVHGGAKE